MEERCSYEACVSALLSSSPPAHILQDEWEALCNNVVAKLSTLYNHTTRENHKHVGETEKTTMDELKTFVGSWADEVEREEQDRLAQGLGDDTQTASPKKKRKKGKRERMKNKLTEVVRKERERQKEETKKERENKLFFGGIIFADLQHKLESELANPSENNKLPSATLADLRQLRMDCFLAIVSEFGNITQFKPNWSKRYCHVVYEDKESAERAYQTLSTSVGRKQREMEQREALESGALPAFIAPLSTYYVRWPRETSHQNQHNNREEEEPMGKPNNEAAGAFAPLKEEENKEASPQPACTTPNKEDTLSSTWSVCALI